MEIDTKESGRMTKGKDKVDMNTRKQGRHMKENGRGARDMVRGNTYISMEISTGGNGSTISNRVGALFYSLMETLMKGHSTKTIKQV